MKYSALNLLNHPEIFNDFNFDHPNFGTLVSVIRKDPLKEGNIIMQSCIHGRYQNISVPGETLFGAYEVGYE